MSRVPSWTLAGGLVAFLTATALHAADPISPEQFNRLHALIKTPPTQDKWEQIPWQTDLWQARQRAAAEGKPILLWEMDGHPLGCT